MTIIYILLWVIGNNIAKKIIEALFIRQERFNLSERNISEINKVIFYRVYFL